MPLTRVCMWDDEERRWKRITIEQASALFPYGTVSARSGLFMCEICHQYVTLIDNSDYQTRHFRHSSLDKAKDCPERTEYNYEPIYTEKTYSLPLRLANITEQNFELELGLLHVPEPLISRELQIEITSDSGEKHVYNRERLNAEGITWLSLGGNPSKEYKLNVINAGKGIQNYWPSAVQGIERDETLFDGETRRRCVDDSDVTVGRKYLLLTNREVQSKKSISATLVCEKWISWKRWNLYEVISNSYDRESVRFFIELGHPLTAEPVAIQPIWPVYSEGPYVTRQNSANVYVCLQGSAQLKAFPAARAPKSLNGSNVYEINFHEKQQLLLASRLHILEYAYFYRDSFYRETKKPTAVVLDLHGVEIPPGEYDCPPEDGILRTRIPYDGYIVKEGRDGFYEKIPLAAEKILEIDGLKRGMTLSIFAGLDCIWRTSWVKRQAEENSNEALLGRLKAAAGRQIPAAHALGSLAEHFGDSPEIRRWLYQCIRRGSIREGALKILREEINGEKG